MATIIRNCKQCNSKFTIGEFEQRWLRKKQLELFSRCENCRKARKEANKQV